MHLNPIHNKTWATHWYAVFISLLLVIATLAVYWQVGDNGFVSFDDGLYVTENPRIQGGLNLKNIRWAFTTTHASNWHPLTWMSHMLDISLFGQDPGAHHFVSLFFHMTNALLLFFVLRKMTGDEWQSGFVAALFALHPLHVESVAWVSERKDVLSTLFWLLTLHSYVWYVNNGKAFSYFTAILFFTMGLLAKPMLVTVPFVLLLLDYWPLGRFKFNRPSNLASMESHISLHRLWKEKIPFFSLAMASCLVTVYAQQSGNSVAPLDAYPMGLRIANALVAYVAYLAKMIWPIHLTAFYPYPPFLPAWQVVGAALVLMAIFIMCGLTAKRQPYLIVGWLMYFGMLFPVIGVVQAGDQAMADRYTYIPLIGIFIMLAWGLPGLLTKSNIQKVIFVVGAALVLPMLMIISWLQVRHWSDNISFYEHMINVTDNNFMAHYNLGVFLAEHKRIDEAIIQYQNALDIKPGHVDANNNLGNALVIQERHREAVKYYTNALNRVPEDPEINNNLGVALFYSDNYEQAIRHFKTALKMRPDYAEARQNLQKALGY